MPAAGVAAAAAARKKKQLRLKKDQENKEKEKKVRAAGRWIARSRSLRRCPPAQPLQR